MIGNKPFDCHSCQNGRVVSVTTIGRDYPYSPDVRLPVPDDFPIMTCENCGETYLSADEARSLALIQTENYLKNK